MRLRAERDPICVVAIFISAYGIADVVFLSQRGSANESQSDAGGLFILRGIFSGFLVCPAIAR
jgi:hypothetical protein